MSYANCAHTKVKNVTISNNATIGGIILQVRNGKDDSASTSFTINISNFKTIKARAACEGYPGNASSYARLYKVKDGVQTLITSQAGAYVNPGYKSQVTADVSGATALKVELLAKGGNNEAKCTSTIVIDSLT